MKEKIKEYFWRCFVIILVSAFVLVLIDFLNKHDYLFNGDFVIILLVIILLDSTWFKKDGKI